MNESSNKNPNTLYINRRVHESVIEKLFRRAIYALIRPIAPNYVRKNLGYWEAPHLLLDKTRLYGLALWHLPQHEVLLSQLIACRIVSHHTFELKFEPKNISSSNKKDRISKVRISITSDLEFDTLITILQNKDVPIKR